ncbi:MAG: protein TolA, partial [Betaproteobacteria bacterium]
MNSVSAQDLNPPPAGGSGPALALSLLAHTLLLLALAWGVNWSRTDPAVALSAEIWAPAEQPAAPAATAPEAAPTPPPPAPPPPPREQPAPPPPPPARLQQEARNAELALEKRRKEQEKQKAEEKAEKQAKEKAQK